MPGMADRGEAEPVIVAPRMAERSEPGDEDGPVICERCGKAEMYRMHAVWRCPECGFTTDCCGW